MSEDKPFLDMEDVRRVTWIGGLAGLYLAFGFAVTLWSIWNLQIHPETAQPIEFEEKIQPLVINGGALFLLLFASFRVWVGKGYVSAFLLIVALISIAYLNYRNGAAFFQLWGIALQAMALIALLISLRAAWASREILKSKASQNDP